MLRILVSVPIFLLLTAGPVPADDGIEEIEEGLGPHFILTVLIEMRWDEGDMYRTYLGEAEIAVREVSHHDTLYTQFIEQFRRDNPPGTPEPTLLAVATGYGELEIEGSGTSGDVYMTYDGTAYIDVTGNLFLEGEVFELTISGDSHERWTVHMPNGETMDMQKVVPITPRTIQMDYGTNTVEINDTWDEGTTREVYDLGLVEDPLVNY